MANPRMPKKGTKGAAKNYISRTQAIKKLQCSLADFRRLCILKGIFPREPRSRKKANKGSTAPASFYYVKDIQYLLHEPVLDKLREHKAFAKKLSRALGREQYGLVKNLDEQKPVYTLDHIIKERYPTFIDSLRDLDDALSLIVLFAHLPASQTVPSAIIANCNRLFSEWQLYIMRTRSLRKVFLSIKGIYYQAEVRGQTVTWLVPYQFTPNVPSDVDFRIMLTFLELYQTLLGFVFYKLYVDANLIYPPKLDERKEGAAAGVGAFLLQEANANLTVEESSEGAQTNGIAPKKVTPRDVKKQIRSISNNPDTMQIDDQTNGELQVVEPESNQSQPDEAEADSSRLFSHYHFYLSREVTRPFLEFITRSMDGHVSWDPVLGQGSPLTVDDARITHHVIDRPMPTDPAALGEVLTERASYPGKRAFIQPQWIVDCLNAKAILPTGPYAPGEVLPPHLSPFIDNERVRAEGGYVPAEAMPTNQITNGEQANGQSADTDSEESVLEDEEEEWAPAASDDEEMPDPAQTSPESLDALTSAIQAAASDPSNAALREAAELEAENSGLTSAEFEARLAQAAKSLSRSKDKANKQAEEKEGDLVTAMITGNKNRRLYKSLKYKEQKQAEEKARLDKKKQAIAKQARKQKRETGV